MSGACIMQLKPDTKPQALFSARNVPIPLRGRVRVEFERMESIGVISRVDKSTYRLVCGHDGSAKKVVLRTHHVDLKPLNDSVLWETFPLPEVDETLTQLSGATTFLLANPS